MNNIEISLVIPAYNEEKRLDEALKDICDFFTYSGFICELILVDDGSKDRTLEITKTYLNKIKNLTILCNARNYGKGYSIRQGVQRARGSIIGFIDADYKTPIGEMNKILPWFEKGFDIVIGSRGIRGAKIERPPQLYRKFGAKAFSIIMHFLIGLNNLVDTQCGFKFFRSNAAKDLFKRQLINGYMFDVEVLFLANKAGFLIKELPVRWRYDPDSRLQLIRGNLNNMIDLFRIRLNHRTKNSCFWNLS